MQAITDIPGVMCIADDIIVYCMWDTNDCAVMDHGSKLLERCKQTGIWLNREKVKLRKAEIPFLGHLVKNTGLQADPPKVEAVQRSPEPNSVEGVWCLNGFVHLFLPPKIPSKK